MSGKDRTVLVDIVDQGIKSLIDRDGCGSLVYAWMMLKKELETAPEEKEEVPAPANRLPLVPSYQWREGN